MGPAYQVSGYSWFIGNVYQNCKLFISDTRYEILVILLIILKTPQAKNSRPLECFTLIHNYQIRKQLFQRRNFSSLFNYGGYKNYTTKSGISYTVCPFYIVLINWDKTNKGFRFPLDHPSLALINLVQMKECPFSFLYSSDCENLVNVVWNL